MINRTDLEQNWNIICEVDLLHYGNHPDQLLALLKKHHRSNFKSEDKILVRHEDVDYFYLDNPIGFHFYNLMHCWQKANIPWHVMLVVTQMYDYGRAVKKHWKFHQMDQPTFLYPLVCEYAYEASLKHWQPNEHEYNIQYPAITLMGTSRAHRVMTYKFIKHRNLFDRIATNYNIVNGVVKDPLNTKTIETADESDDTLDVVHARTVNINESLFYDCNYPEIAEIASVALDQSHEDRRLQGDFKNFYRQSLIDVVTETMFAIPHTYISEKLLRPIFYEKPFILIGPPKTLAFLHAHGIKTFDAWWDEDYDYETDHQLRFLKCCSIIERVSGFTVKQCNEMLEEMRPILEHNKRVLTNYIDTTFTTLYKEKLCLK